MTKSLKICIVGLLILVSSCQHTDFPKGPDCVQLTDSVFCINTALDEDNPDREYDLGFESTRGYRMTPPEHYETWTKFILELAEENEQLKRRLRRCNKER